jgi:predicted branched-subunit amino acid permease
MNQMQDGSIKSRLFAAFGVTDESFAIFTTETKENGNLMYFLGLITITYSSWNLGTFIGAVASDFLPVIVTASLGIALYAMFIGLLFPNLTNNWRLTLLVILTAVCNTLLSQFIASSWALIIATLLCAFAGVFFVEFEDENKEEDNHAVH